MLLVYTTHVTFMVHLGMVDPIALLTLLLCFWCDPYIYIHEQITTSLRPHWNHGYIPKWLYFRLVNYHNLIICPYIFIYIYIYIYVHISTEWRPGCVHTVKTNMLLIQRSNKRGAVTYHVFMCQSLRESSGYITIWGFPKTGVPQ